MISDQVIEDYYCDGCKKKVTVGRRALLGDMPNTLIVHLQRIVFCFDTLMNDKVNSKFEFPTILDLKDYSYKTLMQGKDGIEPDFVNEHQRLMEISDDEYIYRLVGVNVHVGTADHGHYYSLINTKRGDQEINPYRQDGTVDQNKLEKWKNVE